MNRFVASSRKRRARGDRMQCEIALALFTDKYFTKPQRRDFDR